MQKRHFSRFWWLFLGKGGKGMEKWNISFWWRKRKVGKEKGGNIWRIKQYFIREKEKQGRKWKKMFGEGRAYKISSWSQIWCTIRFYPTTNVSHVKYKIFKISSDLKFNAQTKWLGTNESHARSCLITNENWINMNWWENHTSMRFHAIAALSWRWSNWCRDCLLLHSDKEWLLFWMPDS